LLCWYISMLLLVFLILDSSYFSFDVSSPLMLSFSLLIVHSPSSYREEEESENSKEKQCWHVWPTDRTSDGLICHFSYSWCCHHHVSMLTLCPPVKRKSWCNYPHIMPMCWVFTILQVKSLFLSWETLHYFIKLFCNTWIIIPTIYDQNH
jgi:hypothetical protein